MAEIAKRLARRGAFVAFDRVTRQQQWVSDEKRRRDGQALLDAGLVNNLLLVVGLHRSWKRPSARSIKYPGPLHARDGGPGYGRRWCSSFRCCARSGIDEADDPAHHRRQSASLLAFVSKTLGARATAQGLGLGLRHR
jgi:hypothetical protein